VTVTTTTTTTTTTHVHVESETEVTPGGVTAYYYSQDTAGYEVVLIVPTWSVSGPRRPLTPTPDALSWCGVGITLGEPEGWSRECDTCARPAESMDENGTTYCLRCLMPGKDQYGLLLSSQVTWITYDE
jgi:hypothetical protein